MLFLLFFLALGGSQPCGVSVSWYAQPATHTHVPTLYRTPAALLRVAPARRPPRACGHGHRQGHGHRHGHDCDGLGSAEMGPEERRASPDSREKPWAQERPAENLPFGLGVGGGSGGKKVPSCSRPAALWSDKRPESVALSLPTPTRFRPRAPS